jgi:hypothetical protein
MSIRSFEADNGAGLCRHTPYIQYDWYDIGPLSGDIAKGDWPVAQDWFSMEFKTAFFGV